jgi:cytoskeletal protein CcmA (bactofilin family)
MAATKEFGAMTPENTVIGESILISGKLTGDEDLTVRGRVEGEVSLTKTLIVEASGVVRANVEVKNAIVSGVVVGNITATESVELTKDGRMVGDIRSPRVIIVDGASFRGRVDMGDLEPNRERAERPASKPMMRPTIRSASAPPRPPPAPAKTVAKPAAPPAPAKSEAKTESRPTSAPKPAARPAPPPPPAPPVMAEAGKKKVLVKKKH